MRFLLASLVLFFGRAPLQAASSPIRVVTSLPDLASIAQMVGGDKVSVQALSKGYQDPHYVVPRPSLMGAVNQADLFVEVGLSLELWTERVLDGARNPKVRVGQPGHVYASDGVDRLEVPKVLSRAGGDLHPAGNPHIWLDPLNGKIIAANIAAGLKRVDPQDAAYFDARLKEFDAKLDEKLFGPDLVKLLGGKILTRLARQHKLISFLESKSFRGEKLITKLGGWLRQALPARGQKVITYHQTWIYFLTRFGLQQSATIEEKPGIPPSAKRKNDLIRLIQQEGIKLIMAGTYYNSSVPEAMAQATGAHYIQAPVMTGGVKEATDYFALFDYLVAELSKAMKGGEVQP